MSGLVEQFREDAEDFQQEHIGHDFEFDEGEVRFIGDWEATHEAWLFRKWLDEQGYVTGHGRSEHGNQDHKVVVYLDNVDLPDWVSFAVIDQNRLALDHGNQHAIAHMDELDEGIDRLVEDLWDDLTNVSGISSTTVTKLRSRFDTPMDGVGEFDEANGVGSSKAENLDAHVLQW